MWILLRQMTARHLHQDKKVASMIHKKAILGAKVPIHDISNLPHSHPDAPLANNNRKVFYGYKVAKDENSDRSVDYTIIDRARSILSQAMESEN